MRRIVLAAFLMLSALSSYAQSSIKVQAPNLVALDETFNVMFVIEGEHSPSSFEWSPGDDFQLVWGPQKGKSTSVSIVNGKKTSSSQVTYTYVLMPVKAGTFRLAQAEAEVRGETIYSREVTIQVVSDKSQQQSAPQPGTSSDMQSSGTVAGEDLFMRMTLSKTRVVLGETLTATLKLYQRTNLSGIEDAKFPTFDGFWSQELQAPTNIDFQREALGDKIYNSAILRSWTLIPQRAGDLKIDPAELVCSVTVRAPGSSSGSIFDSFFQDDYRTIRKRVTTEAITVHVSALPSGAPVSFGGGVGSFDMSARLTRDSLKAHDAASLIVTVTGKGNVALLEAPKINFPPDFEVYDVKTSDTASGKVFEFPFIPRSHGKFELGPIEYSYYDVNKGKYVTLVSGALPLSVSRSDESASYGSQTVAAPTGKKEVRNIGNDIRYIETSEPSFKAKGDIFAGSGLFWLLTALLAAIAAIVYFVFRVVSARRADIVGTKSRAATKMARKRLAAAGDYLSKDLYSAFYEELHKALLGYVSDKLNMDIADMSKENIAARLSEAGVPEKLCTEFVSLVDACEFARYSPSDGHDAMSAHYEQAVSVISMIDDSMKNKSGKNLAGALVILLALAPFNSFAYDDAFSSDSLWNAGVQAYADGNWKEASGNWIAITDAGLESPELYCNIGDAFFKQREYALAILYYERSLKLDPSYSDARFNLEYANSLIQDRMDSVPEFFLRTWVRKLSYLMSSGSWAVLFLLLFALTLSMVLLFLLSRSLRLRKTGFYASLVLILLSAATLGFSLSQKDAMLSRDKAIVMSPVTSVKSSPDNASTDLFVLHEGAKVTILESVGTWSNIELQDGRQGWIPDADIECI